MPIIFDDEQPQQATQGGPIYTGVDPSVQQAQARTNIAQNAEARQTEQFNYQRQRDMVEDQRLAEEQRREEMARADAQEDALAKLERMVSRIDMIRRDATDNGGWFETGASGAMMRNVPGSAAYSLAEDLATLDANQVLQAMTRLKELSPTGSTGFGALSAPELRLLQSSVASLNPNSDQETFLRNLDEARRVYSDMIDRLQSENAPPQSSNPNTGFGRARSNSETPSDISDIMRRYGVE